jgi:hypothetical protein
MLVLPADLSHRYEALLLQQAIANPPGIHGD